MGGSSAAVADTCSSVLEATTCGSRDHLIGSKQGPSGVVHERPSVLMSDVLHEAQDRTKTFPGGLVASIVSSSLALLKTGAATQD